MNVDLIFANESRARILAALHNGPYTADDLALRLNLSPETVRSELAAMIGVGAVSNDGSDYWMNNDYFDESLAAKQDEEIYGNPELRFSDDGFSFGFGLF